MRKDQMKQLGEMLKEQIYGQSKAAEIAKAHKHPLSEIQHRARAEEAQHVLWYINNVLGVRI